MIFREILDDEVNILVLVVLFILHFSDNHVTLFGGRWWLAFVTDIS